jgi:hypothetical protein
LKVPLDRRPISPETESAVPERDERESSRKNAKNAKRREGFLSAFAVERSRSGSYGRRLVPLS